MVIEVSFAWGRRTRPVRPEYPDAAPVLLRVIGLCGPLMPETVTGGRHGALGAGRSPSSRQSYTLWRFCAGKSLWVNMDIEGWRPPHPVFAFFTVTRNN